MITVTNHKTYTKIIEYLIIKGLRPITDYSVFIPSITITERTYQIHFNTDEAREIEPFVILKFI